MNRKIGVLMSGFLMVFEMLSTLLYTPYLIRTLGQSEYGIYTLVFSITAYLTLLDLGVGNAIVRYVAKYRATGQQDMQRRFLGVATIYYAIIAVLALVLGGVIIAFFPQLFAKGLAEYEIIKAKKLMKLTVLNVAVTLCTSPYMHVLTAYEKFFVSKGIAIIQVFVRVSICSVVLYFGMGSLGVVAVTLTLNLLMRLCVIIYVTFKMKLLPYYKKIEIGFIKKIASYSSWILLQMIATQINHMADQVLIGMFATSSAVILGIYGVGSQINQYFQSIAGAFTGVLMPGVVRIVEKDGSPTRIQCEMERVGRIILMVLGLIWSVFLVFGRQFVLLWAGEKNMDAYIVSLLLMTPQVLILSQCIGAQALWAKEKHKFQSILKFLIVVVNVAVTICLIKIWDPLMGAAVGTTISLILGDILVMQIVFKKDLGLKITSYFRNLFKGILPCIAVCIAIGTLLNIFIGFHGWIGFLLNCGIMVASYGAVLFLFGMNSYEKNLLLSTVKKVIKKLKG